VDFDIFVFGDVGVLVFGVDVVVDDDRVGCYCEVDVVECDCIDIVVDDV